SAQIATFDGRTVNSASVAAKGGAAKCIARQETRRLTLEFPCHANLEAVTVTCSGKKRCEDFSEKFRRGESNGTLRAIVILPSGGAGVGPHLQHRKTSKAS
ncbi:MAG TPA: hypothetical protein VL132_23905, partial [Planctomycetaceae bacterium]|nr:hypothetical protein [Planctomycetaceae bacterium]